MSAVLLLCMRLGDFNWRYLVDQEGARDRDDKGHDRQASVDNELCIGVCDSYAVHDDSEVVGGQAIAGPL